MTSPKRVKFLGEIMMNKEKLLREAEYADIILTLLNSPYVITSITKLIFIAFCVRYESNISAYKNRSKDFIDVFFKNISLKLSAHYDDIELILHFVDILKNTSKVSISVDYIELISEFKHLPENHFLQFCAKKVPNPIVEINKLDAKALLEEVIRYV